MTGNELDKDVLPFRYKIYDSYNNRAMAAYVPDRASFSSTVSPYIAEFYEQLKDNRHVLTPEGPLGTNDILSVSYYVTDVEWKDDKCVKHYHNGNNDVYMYIDDKALPIGFTYDTYMTRSEYANVDGKYTALAMLKTLIIEDEDEPEVSKVLRKYDSQTDGEYADFELNASLKAEHQDEVSQNFHYSSRDFGSTITTDAEKYAFFSVPYSDSWSATVNEISAEVLNINGLMAVKVDKGVNEIKFSYENKGLKYGFILSIIGIIIWCTYYVYNLKKRKSNDIINS